MESRRQVIAGVSESGLVHAGKIRAFGASTVATSEIVEAQWTAGRRGRERFRTEQPPTLS